MITIGSNEFESFKTVPNVEERPILVDPCDPPMTLPLGASVLREIEVKRKAFNQAATFNSGTGNYELQWTVIDPFLQAMANYGLDNRVFFDFTLNGYTPIAGLPTFPHHYIYTYTFGLPGVFWQDISSGINGGTSIIASQAATGGNYANGEERISIWLESSTPFSIDLIVKVFQRVLPIYEVFACVPEDEYGTETSPNRDPFQTNHTNLLCYVDYNTDDKYPTKCIEIEVTEGDETPPTTKIVCFADYPDDYELDTPCAMYYRYYIAKARTLLPNTTDLYSMENDIERIQLISSPSTGGHAYYGLGHSAVNQIIPFSNDPLLLTGTTDLTLIDPAITAFSQATIEGLPNPISNSLNVSFQYDLQQLDCDCGCIPVCEGQLKIIFTNNCGETVAINIEGSVVDGKYPSSGEGFETYDGQTIYPEISLRNEYILTISDYTDETWKTLAYLFANNKYMEIKGRDYTIEPQTIEPVWDSYSQKGTARIPIVEKDSNRTIRRDCCG